MKKFTIICFLTLLSAAIYAQDTIPNSNFERWAKPTGQSFIDPISWQTTNDLLVANGSDTVNVFKDSINLYNAESTVKMITKSVSFPIGGGQVYTENISGGLVEGKMVLNVPSLTFSGGFPFNGKPAHLTGYYEYTNGGSDSYSMMVILYGWDTLGNRRDTVAIGYATGSANESSFVPFSFNLNYFSANLPDTALIAFFSSADIIGTAGSILWVSDISFQGSAAGINEVKQSDVVSVFPNPAQDVIYINAVPGQYRNATIYDMMGRNVGTQSVNGNSIDVHGLTDGNYILMLNDQMNNTNKAVIAVVH